MTDVIKVLLTVAVMVCQTVAVTCSANAADAHDVLSSDKRFRTWVSMVDAADEKGYTAGQKPYTIFAIVDESMSNIDANLMHAIAPKASSGRGIDDSEMRFVVQSHVLPGKQELSEIAGKLTTFRSVNGNAVKIDATKNPIEVTFVASTGTISGPPLNAGNVIIYPVLLKSAHYVAQ